MRSYPILIVGVVRFRFRRHLVQGSERVERRYRSFPFLRSHSMMMIPHHDKAVNRVRIQKNNLEERERYLRVVYKKFASGRRVRNVRTWCRVYSRSKDR